MNIETLSRLKVTGHARAAMRDRDVRPEEVIAVLRAPEVVEAHEGRERYVAHGLVAVIAWEGEVPVLVTVLLREGRQWTNADARRR